VVLFALQAFLWGGGSIVEARAAAESLTRHSHVEDQGTTACPPIHSHLDCVVCRTFASGALPVRARDAIPRATQEDCRPSSIAGSLTTADEAGPLGSRAPPAGMTPDRSIA
jgi:hypothetical protein